MSMASCSSFVRMPSSRAASSRSCSAPRVGVRTSARRLRRRPISARMRVRSASRAVGTDKSVCATLVRLTATINTATTTALCARRRFAQCMLGRLLLRLFFRRSLAARGQVADLYFDDEPLVMIRPYFADDAVLRQRHPAPLCHFLQRGLVILKEEVLLVDGLEIGRKHSLDETSHGLDPAVEVDRRQHGLEEVGQQRVLLPAAGLLFTDSEEKNVSHAVGTRLLGKARGADEIGLHLRKRSLVELWKTAEKKVADDEAENGVAEEFKSLVVSQGVVLRLV